MKTTRNRGAGKETRWRTHMRIKREAEALQRRFNHHNQVSSNSFLFCFLLVFSINLMFNQLSMCNLLFLWLRLVSNFQHIYFQSINFIIFFYLFHWICLYSTHFIIKNYYLVDLGEQQCQYDSDLIGILKFWFVLSIILKLSFKLW